ncbi:hypothetical protein OH492_14170 [Vibrio chagasii]|nr:hypothetical protein [Vibrio chagasii]
MRPRPKRLRRDYAPYNDHGYSARRCSSGLGLRTRRTSNILRGNNTAQLIEEIGAGKLVDLNLLSGERHEARLPPIDLIVRESTGQVFITLKDKHQGGAPDVIVILMLDAGQ